MADEDKKKPSLASVIAIGGKDDSDKDMESSEDDGDFDAAAEELFEAIKSDDMEGFKTALRAVKAC